MNTLWQMLMASDVVHRLGWVLVHSTWLGAAVAVLLAASQWIMRRRSANARYVAGCAAMLAVVGLSASSWFFNPIAARSNLRHAHSLGNESAKSASEDQSSTASISNVTGSGMVSPVESSQAVSIPNVSPVSVGNLSRALWARYFAAIDPALPRLVPLWAVGVLMLALWQLGGWNAAHRIRRQSLHPRDESVRASLARLAHRMSIRTPIDVLESTAVRIPSLIGWLRPAILLPIGLASGLTSSQLEAILTHELAHIQRHDYLVNLLQSLVETLFFYHPAIWYISACIRVERENCCDDLALKFGAEPLAYAESLLCVAQRALAARGLAVAHPSLMLGATGKISTLRRRVRRLLGATEPAARESWPAAFLMIAAIATAFILYSCKAADRTSVNGQPVQQKESPKLNPVATLKPGTEEILNWGDPVNGLRAAVVIRTLTDKPKAGEMPDLYVAVQNVSKAPIRFNDSLAEQQPRMLYLKLDGRTQAGIGAKDPRLGDRTLQPGEVTFVLMYVPERSAVGRTIGSLMAEDVRKDTHQSMVGEMLIERAPAGAWTGKLITGETSGSVASGEPQPKDTSAQALYKVWQHGARKSGNIPGGFLGRLGQKVNEFIRVNSADASGAPYARKMEPLAARIIATRDWTLAEAVALLDDIAAVSPAPIDTAMEEADGVTLKPGAPLPKELATAPWGEALPNGLRMAWLMEPHAAEHRLGTPLKSRLLFHNAGKEVVVFRTRMWHQGQHTARDAKGADLKVESIDWLTRGKLAPFRLWPGDFIEINATGFGIGADKELKDYWQNARVGSWIEPNAGDDVTITTAPIALGDWDEKPPRNADSRWWLDLITARLNRELPMPAEADERAHLVYRAGREIFGTPLSAEEIAAFVSDRDPGALDSLANRFAHRAGTTPGTGSLQSGPTRFQVLPADPDATEKNHAASKTLPKT